MAESIENICDFPPELLEEIFRNLKDPRDFQAVINTCSLWHNIMEYRKAERLFGNVLPILLKLENDGYPVERMLVFRQVCKEWKRETDRQLSLQPIYHKLYFFVETEKVQRFLSHASTLPHGANPLVGNYVILYFDDERGYQTCLDLIRRYGTHIKTIFLDSRIESFPLTELQSCLHFMPNLEYLEVEVFIETWNVGEDAPTLPPLPFLTGLFLSTDVKYYIPRCIRMMEPDTDNIQQRQFILPFLTAYGSQLTKITSSPFLLRIDSISDWLPNLVMLEIEGSALTLLTEEDLNTLSKVVWKLEKLVIGSYGRLTIQFSTALIAMLNNFNGTLTILHLPFQLEDRFDLSGLAVFPCLESMSLRVSSTFSEFTEEMRNRLNLFSVACPYLQELDITTVGTMMNDAVRLELQFAEMQRGFPQLKEFIHRRYIPW